MEVHFYIHGFHNVFFLSRFAVVWGVENFVLTFVTFHFRFRSAALVVHGAGERAELGGSARPGAGCAVRAPGRGA